MAKIYTSLDQLMGHTPLLSLNYEDLVARVLVKLECFNPGGSIKDRAAKAMLDDAESRGVLTAGATVIEPTSGNTGIGLAAICAARGYKAIIVMPDSMSAERINLMKAYGAEVVLTPGNLGMAGAIAKAESLAAEIPDSLIPGQFDNPANPLAHDLTTGPEIWTDTAGKVDIFVAGVGTGGTITGTGRYLKEKKPAVQIVAVEPDTSAVLSGESAGAHGIQGIGAGFIPSILDTEIYDEIIRCAPAEIVCNDEFMLSGLDLQDLTDRLGIVINTLGMHYFDEAAARKVILSHFHVSSLIALGMDDKLTGSIAAGALLKYLYDTQMNGGGDFDEPQ